MEFYSRINIIGYFGWMLFIKIYTFYFHSNIGIHCNISMFYWNAPFLTFLKISTIMILKFPRSIWWLFMFLVKDEKEWIYWFYWLLYWIIILLLLIVFTIATRSYLFLKITKTSQKEYFHFITIIRFIPITLFHPNWLHYCVSLSFWFEWWSKLYDSNS